MAIRPYVCVVAAAIFLSFFEGPWKPSVVEARSIPASNTCEVCHKHPSNYQPLMRMEKFANSTVCITNTFGKSEEGDSAICGSVGRAPDSVPSGAVVEDIPSCRICDNNGSEVAAMQKVWSLDDGTQCVSAAFVEKF